MKIRIFFRHNKFVPKYLNRRQMNEEYSLLYYQFIKHAFGFIYSNSTEKIIDLIIALYRYHASVCIGTIHSAVNGTKIQPC